MVVCPFGSGLLVELHTIHIESVGFKALVVRFGGWGAEELRN
jgi:hypothetical protein